MEVDTRPARLRRVARFVWNPDEGRVRAVWRILAATALVLVAPGLVVRAVVRPLELPLSLRGLAANATYASFTALAVVAWARRVDRRPLAEYGFDLDRAWATDLAVGAAIGLVGWGGALATDLAAGWARVETLFAPGVGGVAPALAFAAFTLQWGFVAFWEETLFRGIVLRNAVEGLSVPWLSRRTALAGGLLASSLFFGVLHAGQASSTLALAFWVVAGLVLGVAYLTTGQLAVPMGLHFAFDFAVNNAFGLSSVRPVGARAPTLVRPAFTASRRLIGISGAVNTAWLVAIGGSVLAVVALRHGSLRSRIGRDDR